jgi:hypothetical protein
MTVLKVENISFNVEAVKKMTYNQFIEAYKGKMKTKALLETANYLGLKKPTVKKKVVKK